MKTRAKNKGLGGVGTGISGGQFAEKGHSAPGTAAALLHTRGKTGARLRLQPDVSHLGDGVKVENYAFEPITTGESFAMSYGGVCDPGRVSWAPEAGSEKDEHGLDPRNVHFSGGPFLNSARACLISGFARTHDEGWHRLESVEAAWALRYDRRPTSSLASRIAQDRRVATTMVTVEEMDELAARHISERAEQTSRLASLAEEQYEEASGRYAQHRFAITRQQRLDKRDALVAKNLARHALEMAQADHYVATGLFDGPDAAYDSSSEDDPHGYYSSMRL